MSDDLMDARLRAAGERWRAADEATVPPAETASAPRPAPVVRHRGRWVAALSAAVIAGALVVSGAVLLANRNTSGTPVAEPQSSQSHASAPRPATPLVGTRWELTQLVTATGAHTPDGEADLQFMKNRFFGSDGCNSLGGEVRVSARTVELNDVFSTAMACLGSTANQVSGMLTSGTLEYRITGSSLVLTRPGQGMLIYRAASSSVKQNPSQLVGPRWTLQSTEVTTHSGGSVSASGHSAVAQSVLTFGGGSFTVQHRCYTNQGKAALGAGTADLSAVSLKTAIPCSSGTNVRAEQQENAFIDDLLSGRVSWHIEQDVLTISKGGHSATFGR